MQVPGLAVSITRVLEHLVVTVGADLGPHALAHMQEQTLERVHSVRPRAVIFECSALQFVDRHEFEQLRRILRMVEVLGARACLVGLSPGIVKYLVLAEVDCSGLRAFLDLNQALAHYAAPSGGEAATAAKA